MFWTVMTIMPTKILRNSKISTNFKKNMYSNKIKQFLNKKVEHNLYDFKYFEKVNKGEKFIKKIQNDKKLRRQ